MEETVANGDSTGADRLFIKFIDSENNATTYKYICCYQFPMYNMEIRINEVFRFFVTQSGVQWYVKFQTESLQETVRLLQKNYHSADFFKSNLFKRFVMIGQGEEQSLNTQDDAIQ